MLKTQISDSEMGLLKITLIFTVLYNIKLLSSDNRKC